MLLLILLIRNNASSSVLCIDPGSGHGDVQARQGKSGPHGPFFRLKMRFLAA
jgi:hypothetical protein